MISEHHQPAGSVLVVGGGIGGMRAALDLADTSPAPKKKLPGGLRDARLLSWQSDFFALLTIPQYRRAVRRAWGRHMAPVDRVTRIWSGAALAAGLLGYLLERLGQRHKK